MPSHRQLLRLLAERSFRLGQFTLASGATSDYYIDCRLTTLSAKGARLTGAAVLEEIRARGWGPRAIGGVTLGAGPILGAGAGGGGGTGAPVGRVIGREGGKEHGAGAGLRG